MTTLAPSLPSTPGSLGLGLLARVPLPFRNPSMPGDFWFLAPAAAADLPSAGNVVFFSAKSDQLPVSPSVTCMPPLLVADLVPARARPEALPPVVDLLSLRWKYSGSSVEPF